MFGKRKKRQARVEVSFIGAPELSKHIIEVQPEQEFIEDIGADGLWEGSTLIRQYNWVAGYTIIYEYFYR